MNPLPRAQLFAYGGLGLPLAFAALPLYVHLAPFYSAHLSLTLLGLLLLGLRAFDAVIDPLLGALFDRFPHPRRLILAALPLLGLGWVGLFNPPAQGVLPWLIVTLTLTTVGYSLASVVHNTWGARIHPAPHERTRLFAAREGFGLAGVVLAATLPLLLSEDLASGLRAMGWIFLALLVVFAAWTLLVAPVMRGGGHSVPLRRFLHPFANRAFARFIPGYLLNGVAAALPATLVIFFIDDVLQLKAWGGLFLGLYFVSGALGLPLWVALARRIGKLDAWLASMGLSVVTFAGAFWLGSGDLAGFALVCVASGLALGADLALPPALVADFIDADDQPVPGAYYGLLGFFAKFTLALAAGLALPLLALLGYQPGGSQVWALSATYALLPCLLKLAAFGWFWAWRPRLQTGVVPC
ncbi:MAG: MFS transporter [Thiobacillus sp.]|nr:MFS transporter [Thiobacillus sp.]